MRRSVKFFECKFSDNVYKRNILSIGTYDMYRSMEEGDGIGDRLEASRIPRVKGRTIDENMPPAQKAWVEKELNVTTSSGGKISFLDNVTYVLPNAYIYCISYGNPKTLKRPSDRDSAFLIQNKNRFYVALTQSEVLSGKYAGHRLQDICVGGCFGRVTYQEIESDVFSGRTLDLSPFIKRPVYYEQCEYRFVFNPIYSRPICEKSILVKVENLQEMIQKYDLENTDA